MNSFSKINTLLIYASYTDKLSYHDDWKDAFLRDSDFVIKPFNIIKSIKPQKLARDIKNYDFIVILHSCNADRLLVLEQIISVLNNRNCRLLTFVGNEVNLPNDPLARKIIFFKSINAEYIGTQLPYDAGAWLYDECKNSKVIPLPHALNPYVFSSKIDLNDRMIDIGVRSNKYLPYLGDDERNELYNFFIINKKKYNLAIDFDTENRFNREDWARFLNNCKGTLSNEAGSYYLERDDKTVNEIKEYVLSQHKENIIKLSMNSYIMRMLKNNIPESIKAIIIKVLNKQNLIHYEKALYRDIAYNDIGQIINKFFLKIRKNPIYTKAISSRNFDAIGTKTCQILLEGKYNDILKPDVHYISLKHDYSNIDDVMRRFQDMKYVKNMVDFAYEYVMESHTHKNRIDYIKSLI